MTLSRAPCSFGRSEREKKIDANPSDSPPGGDEGYSIKAFEERLRHLCPDDIVRAGRNRTAIAQNQAKQAVALAGEAGFLIRPKLSWQDFREEASVFHGAEHVVELAQDGEMVKVTIPPGFGLIPAIVSRPQANLRNAPEIPSERAAIEFLPATPLEYLARWLAANEVFGDDVRIASVVEWADSQVSFTIRQPQYHGEPAPEREIERFFLQSGWTRLRNRSGHSLYYNYAYQTLAIDALPRNCYLNGSQILPFDVILCHPDRDLEQFLALYPD